MTNARTTHGNKIYIVDDRSSRDFSTFLSPEQWESGVSPSCNCKNRLCNSALQRSVSSDIATKRSNICNFKIRPSSATTFKPFKQ
uniref:Uncharacterized protein n=1 Tax=Pararge aegeria TaxID=116150 RepID=S4PC53_9NEOP